jgi:ribonuclease HI
VERARTYALESVVVQVDTVSSAAWALVGPDLELVGVPARGRMVKDVHRALETLPRGVVHASLANARDLGPTGPSQVVASPSSRYTERARELARATAVRSARASLPPVHPDALVVATDGSFDHASGTAGAAWVSADGRTGFSHKKAKAPHVVELMALTLALEANQHVPHLHLLSDSMGALRAVGKVLEGRKSDLDPLLKALVKRKGLTLEWVRGHDDHPLNEAADHLSRAARQPRAVRRDHIAHAGPYVHACQELWRELSA